MAAVEIMCCEEAARPSNRPAARVIPTVKSRLERSPRTIEFFVFITAKRPGFRFFDHFAIDLLLMGKTASI